ncbi:MAG: hypothetical protein ABIP94_25790 [Planctomycetota bacterium]
MRAPFALRHLVAPAVAIALAISFSLHACGKSAPPAETRLLVVDGMEIELAEVMPYVEFLDSFLPELGRKTKIMRVLDDHVLPVHAARRAFAAERLEQLDRAEALSSVATNTAELEEKATLVKDQSRRGLTRLKALLPVAMFLFDPLKLGSVSPPIEVASGYFVVGCFDLTTSPLAIGDHVDALQVGFVTHSAAEWFRWFESEKERIATKVTFVHPEYRDAMPQWLVLPKLP